MWRRICSFLLFRVMGWKAEVTVPRGDKYIMALAPHTSNFDFILGLLYSCAEGFRCDFLMKKEWFFWPLGVMMRKWGGIPVFRNKQTNRTDHLAEVARGRTSFHLCITPEGTRSRTEEWKKGFYYIALKAGLPILLYGVDYPTKTIRCTRMVIPDGDVDRQMSEIKDYFKAFRGKHPWMFTTGPM
ncbi:MAG: 1-acyl-sn-glycerol-3-phosphate acyltransferase [Paraprevotella sp.]|nr:1-acyl-sn-glycerol-3-phosphate acyltransferase [Paraprevotella sp.]